VVKARVQKIRGLKLKADVPVTYLSVADTEARFRAEFAREISQEEIDTGVEENKMIGLFPPDLKIERKDLADMTLELAGFYDDHHKDIVIMIGLSRSRCRSAIETPCRSTRNSKPWGRWGTS